MKWCGVMCCVVLDCFVLRSVVLCCVALCCDVVCCVVLCCVVVCCVAMRCVALRYEGNTGLRYGVMCCVALRCAAAPLANLHPAQPRFNFGGQFSLQIRGASFELSDASHRCACMCTRVLIQANTCSQHGQMRR